MSPVVCVCWWRVAGEDLDESNAVEEVDDRPEGWSDEEADVAGEDEDELQEDGDNVLWVKRSLRRRWRNVRVFRPLAVYARLSGSTCKSVECVGMRVCRRCASVRTPQSLPCWRWSCTTCLRTTDSPRTLSPCSRRLVCPCMPCTAIVLQVCDAVAVVVPAEDAKKASKGRARVTTVSRCVLLHSPTRVALHHSALPCCICSDEEDGGAGVAIIESSEESEDDGPRRKLRTRRPAHEDDDAPVLSTRASRAAAREYEKAREYVKPKGRQTRNSSNRRTERASSESDVRAHSLCSLCAQCSDMSRQRRCSCLLWCVCGESVGVWTELRQRRQ